MLIGFILVLLSAALSAAALAETPQGNGNCSTIGIGDYASFSFCTPSGVSIRPDTGAEQGYAGGRDASTSLWLDDNMVQVHLLYPCDTIGSWLDLEGLRERLEAFNPLMKQSAVYDSIPLMIDGRQAITGSWTNIGVRQEFAVYQPGSTVLAAIFFNANTPSDIISSFIGSLKMSINAQASPLRYSDCPQVETSTPVPVPTPSPVPAPAPVHIHDRRVIHHPFGDNSSPSIPGYGWDFNGPVQENLYASIEQLKLENQAIHEKLQVSREKLLEFSGLGYSGFGVL